MSSTQACGGRADRPPYGAYRDLVTSVTCVDWPQTLHPRPYLDVEADLTQPMPDAGLRRHPLRFLAAT